MIKMKQIKRAISMKLFSRFGIKPTSRDITEGFDRPSFFIELSPKKDDLGGYLFQREVEVKIYYFPDTKEGDLTNKLTEVQEELEQVFDSKLQVSDRYLNIEESESDKMDSTLIFSFKLDYIDTKDYLEEQHQVADEMILRH